MCVRLLLMFWSLAMRRGWLWSYLLFKYKKIYVTATRYHFLNYWDLIREYLAVSFISSKTVSISFPELVIYTYRHWSYISICVICYDTLISEYTRNSAFISYLEIQRKKLTRHTKWNFHLQKSSDKRFRCDHSLNLCVNIKPLTYKWPYINICQEDFEYTKGVISIRKSRKDRQHNDQKKKDKRTNNDLQNNIQKTRDRAK